MGNNNYIRPNNYNKGFREIPKIKKASKALYKTASFEISGEKILGNSFDVFIDHESPKGSFNTMNSNEIHIAIRLQQRQGQLIKSDIIKVNVPENELMKKEKNPVSKSNGILKITFSKEEAVKLASGIRS